MFLKSFLSSSSLRFSATAAATSTKTTVHKRLYSFAIPYVLEKTNNGERSYDIYSRLLKDRIICLHSPVNAQVSSSIVAQLLLLESQDSKKPIYLYINSPGGSVHDGLAIYDTMKFIKSPIRTVCMGMAASMGAFLLCGGEKGFRFALPNARIMIHQPLGGTQGQASDIAIHAEEILGVRKRLNAIMASNSGRTLEEVERAVERDNYMSPQDAIAFGLIDAVMERKSLLVE